MTITPQVAALPGMTPLGIKPLRAYQVINGTSYDARTPQAVIDILQRFAGTNERLRYFYGDAETGRAWPEEHDVIGRLGRSTGTHKIPLLLKTHASTGGAAMLDHCIVAIVRVKTGEWLYKHVTFDCGVWDIPGKDGEAQDYPFPVTKDGEIQARFETLKKAQNYMAFMRGERFSK